MILAIKGWPLGSWYPKHAKLIITPEMDGFNGLDFRVQLLCTKMKRKREGNDSGQASGPNEPSASDVHPHEGHNFQRRKMSLTSALMILMKSCRF